MKPRLPVYVITGFLGSGKTTLLNQLLYQLPKSAVIINEFGSVPVDQQLLREHQVPLSSLVGGCLCCQVIGALAPVLKNLRMAWEKQPSSFDRIIIETSGVANPAPIFDALLKDRWLSARYSLQQVLTTVSATMDLAYLDYFPEAQAQIAWADTLVLTQTDLADNTQITNITQRLSELAPVAKWLKVINGQMAVDELFTNQAHFRLLSNKALTDDIEHSFASAILQLPSAIAWQRLEPALIGLLKQYPQHLIRIKGIIYEQDEKQPLAIHAAFGDLHPPIRLPHRPNDGNIGRLVFIGSKEVQVLVQDLLVALR